MKQRGVEGGGGAPEKDIMRGGGGGECQVSVSTFNTTSLLRSTKVHKQSLKSTLQ